MILDMRRIAVPLGGCALIATLGSLAFGSADASDRVTKGSVFVDVGAGREASDVLLPAEAHPRTAALVGGALGVSFGVTSDWLISVSGRGLGAWFDYSNVLGAGQTESFEPLFRLGLDRVVLGETKPKAVVGIGFEYSEVRSWVHNIVLSTPYNSTGPTNYRRGGSIRAMLLGDIGKHVGVFAELSESVYLAHASDSSLLAEYNWLGTGTFLAVGIRFGLRGGSRN